MTPHARNVHPAGWAALALLCLLALAPQLVQAHPWAYDWTAAPRFDESRDSGLLQALRARLVAAP